MIASARLSWMRIGLFLGPLALLATAGLSFFLLTREGAAGESEGNGKEVHSGVKADVISPKAGGIPRLCVQPGSVEPYAGAALYAKVFGQLKTLNVDIGSRVKEGDLLAEIEVPERDAELLRCQARVDDTIARSHQAEAQKSEAEAEARAADASVVLASTVVKAKTAFREYREKQLSRIKDLVARKAEDQRLQDEQEDYYLSALEAENGAKEKVNAEKERAAAARAKIERVVADIASAKADIAVARAEVANAKVWVEYGKIRSPYSGVITQRGYLRGDFIKAGDQGGHVAILTVVATDVLRVVVPVPDRDVPFVTPGKPAILTFDALPGAVYQTNGTNKVVVSRLAESESYETRLMRVEVDIHNTDGKLRQGMYGRATLVLTDGEPGALHIPSAALAGRANDGMGTVRVVRDGKLATATVKFGMDNGVDVEILSGISVNDQVVIGTNVPATDGTPVSVRKMDQPGS